MIRAQVPPSAEDTEHQNYIVVIGIPPICLSKIPYFPNFKPIDVLVSLNAWNVEDVMQIKSVENGRPPSVRNVEVWVSILGVFFVPYPLPVRRFSERKRIKRPRPERPPTYFNLFPNS
ncbi:hypothetical protein TNCV_4291951 [Trichonephila clavipes]|uniref:Uncharacterized protein n=1 Tax=Trichonephila clavipes TaxID=2585209 RepID=A0A8X6RHC4_TRICX|nr:hypothetical protein TNCV_4291951 [Trichonephila clavipes]